MSKELEQLNFKIKMTKHDIDSLKEDIKIGLELIEDEIKREQRYLEEDISDDANQLMLKSKEIFKLNEKLKGLKSKLNTLVSLKESFTD